MGDCVYCGASNCDDCLLPFDDMTLRELLSKVPKGANDLEIDNNYLFLNDKHRYYINSFNRDFQLELTWLNEYVSTVQSLNDKKDYDFKIHKSLKNKSVCIYDCFKNFVKLEKLEENNEWYCPTCKKHQRATKKMEIYKAPHILIVHLKRFRNHSKIDTVVDFPIDNLDIKQYVICNDDNLPLNYELFGIANHYGSLGFGHYTSFARNPIDNQWYEFDDSHVSRKNPNDLITSAAYVLFYRRKGLENYINLEDIYKKDFVNYENQVEVDVDMNSCNITNVTKQEGNYDIQMEGNSNTGVSEESKYKEHNIDGEN